MGSNGPRYTVVFTHTDDSIVTHGSVTEAEMMRLVSIWFETDNAVGLRIDTVK